MSQKIITFKDLDVWRKAYELVLLTYKETSSFPKEELFGLTNQMRRAAASIPANIAEGFGRTSSKDKEHFYVMAYGSLMELDNHYEVALGLNFIGQERCERPTRLIEETGKLLNGLLNAHRNKASGF